MQDVSLLKALKTILLNLEESDIDLVDKVELMINISHFLDIEDYEENIKVLQKEIIDGKNKKWKQ